jgi:hypothetical protein
MGMVEASGYQNLPPRVLEHAGGNMHGLFQVRYSALMVT